MKQHFQNIHHHVKKAHEHIKKHTKKAHEHLKRHGKWYIYGHILAASVIFSVALNSHSRSDASVDTSLCTQDFSAMNMVLEYTYTAPKKDVMLKWISFDKVIFPELILVNKVKQLKPVPNKNELSTDRGDLASYINPNKEDPTEEEIADYLSNNNLNNIIDGEGRWEVILDVELEKIVYDNTKQEDVIGELLIFERGMNADMYIQSVDSLGWKELGKKIFLNRKDLIYAGFDVDTVEIGAAQKMGYWKVDLAKLNVWAVKFLRISSQPKNSGPDFKIIWLNTKKCKPKQLESLQVEAICSAVPANTRYWKVNNPNNEKVEFTWDLYRTTEWGINTIDAKWEVVIQSSPAKDWPSMLRIYIDGALQDIFPSSEEKCPIVQPEIPLELEAICSSEPESHRMWKVTNKNLQWVQFDWNIPKSLSCKGNKVLVCQVPPGNPTNEHEICIAKPAVNAHLAKGSYLGECKNSISEGNSLVWSESSVTITTPILDEDQELLISVDWVEHDTALSTTTLCPKQPVNDYTISLIADKQEVYPGEEIVYTLEYSNVGPETMQSGALGFVFDENVEYVFNESVLITNNKILLPTLAPNTKETITIKAKIKQEIKSDSVVLKTFISAPRDINNDNNTVTSTILIKEVLPLEISSLCSDNPSAVRAWRIQNPNPIDVPVDLYIQDEFSTSIVAKANELTYTKTNTVDTDNWSNTVALRYNGDKQSETSSEAVACPKPISDLAVENVAIEMISEEIFVAEITFANLGPNVSNEITIGVATDDNAVLVDDQLVQSEIQQTVEQMNVEESYVVVVTGALISWDAELAIVINGQTIDPNIYNNNSQQTVSSSSYIAPLIEDVEEWNEDEHNAPDQEPEDIQGYELWEKIDIDEHMQENQDMENMIGLGCNYQDVDYENIIFQDVKNHRSKAYVELLRVNCIVRGREANTFVTDDSIKRAEAIKVAIKLWGMQNNRKIKSENYIYLGDTPMSDVNNAHWSAQYIDQAYQIGLLDSLYKWSSTKKLFPDQSITRGEAVELLIKTYLLLNQSSLWTSEIMITAIFEDIDSKSSFTPYIAYAYERWFLQGAMDEWKQVFLPNQKISRSEFAKIAALIFKDFLSVYRIK
jgi:hypothetical protein